MKDTDTQNVGQLSMKSGERRLGTTSESTIAAMNGKSTQEPVWYRIKKPITEVLKQHGTKIILIAYAVAFVLMIMTTIAIAIDVEIRTS